MLTSIRFLRFLAAAVLVVGGLARCTESPTQPQPATQQPGGKLVVHANVAATSVNQLVLQVSGPGIVKSNGTPDTLSFNIDIVNGIASGTIVVPAGPSRVVTARAFNGIVETHRGSVTTDIAEGVNPQVALTLVPLVGDVPITVSFGTTLVIVRPAVATLAVHQTQQMSAEIRDNNGAIVQGAVRWASLNPGKATVTEAGLVTMRDTGEVQIVATYGTVGGSAKLTGVGHLNEVPYQLVWNGSVSQSWNEPNNWTPHELGAARVPTAADSVYIPASVPRHPRLEACADSPVRDLVIEAGATLTTYCGYGVELYGAADVQGSMSARLRTRLGASLAGNFDYVYVEGDSTTLAGPVTASYVEVNGTVGALALDGHKLTVALDFNVNGSATVTLAGSDTLVVNRNVSWSGGDHTDRITGGVVLFRGTSFYGYRYKATGTNRLVFDRTATGRQQISGFDFYNAPDRAGLSRWHVRNAEGVQLCGYVAATDTITFESIGTPSVVDASCGYHVRAYGPVVTGTNTHVDSYLWDLRHPTGTSLVSGTWSPTYTDFHGVNAEVKPGLAYEHLRFYASNQLLGAVTTTGVLQVVGTSTVLDLAGHDLTVGGHLQVNGAGSELRLGGSNVAVADYLHVTNGGLLSMQHAADTVDVQTYASFDWNGSAEHATRMTAGLLRVARNFYAYGFGSTGTHRVELRGVGADSTNPGQLSGSDKNSRPSNDIRRLAITGGVYNLCAHVRVTDTLTLTTSARLQQGCGGYYLETRGPVITDAGTSVGVYVAEVAHASGTSQVSGGWRPSYTDIHADGAVIKPSLTYQHLRVFRSTAFSGNTSVAGYLLVSGAGVELDVNGNTVQVGDYLHVQNTGVLVMDQAADAVLVANQASFDSNGSAAQAPKMSAGLLRVGANFYGYGFGSTGTHVLELAGTSTAGGGRRIHGLDMNSRPTNDVRQLRISGGAYELCNHARVGVLEVQAGDSLVAGCGGYTIEVREDLRTSATSTFQPYNVNLFSATGTQNVNGAYTPEWTSLHTALAAGALKPGLGYRNIAIYAPVTLTGAMAVNGELYVRGPAANVTLNGHTLTVASTLNLDDFATITMTNPADRLEANGDVYWDGGGNHSGRLTTGTLIHRGNRFYGCNYFGTADNKVVFARTTGLNSVECVNGGAPQNMPFEHVEVTGTGVALTCHMWVGGSLRVRAGARIEPQCGGGSVWVTDTLYTEAGSTLANHPVNNWTLSVVLYDTTGSGTSQVNGTYSAGATYFVARDAFIKPDLDYKYVRVDASTRFRGTTEIDGALDVIANAILDLGGSRVTVGGTLNFDSNAKLRMNSAADTLVVAMNDPNADIFWDGGDNLTGDSGSDYLLTNGVILFHGQRMYGPRYRPVSGSAHKFVFANNNGALAAVSVEGMNADPNLAAPPSFNRLEIAGLRPVHVNNRMRVNDTLRLAPNARLTGTDYLWLAGVTGGGSAGDLVTGAGSLISMPNVYLDDPSGTRYVQGVFRPTRTYFRATLPEAQAIRPGLDYTDVFIHGGTYVLAAGDTTMFAGSLEVIGNAATLDLGGRRLRVRDGNVVLGEGGRLIMAPRSGAAGPAGVDSLLIGGSFHAWSNAGVSTLSGGVIVMSGNDFIIDRNDLPLTGTRLVLDGSAGTAFQNIHTGGTNRDLYQVDIVGTRPVRLQRGTVIADALRLLGSTSSLTSNQALTVRGVLSSVAGSTITFSSLLSLHDGSGTSQISGTYSNSSTTRFNEGSTVIQARAGMSYGHLEVFGFASIAGGPLAISGNLQVGTDALYGPDNVSLTLPAGSTIGGSISTYGPLSFAASATTAGDLTVLAGGSATAMGTGPADFVDFRSIYLNGPSGVRGAGVLDNQVASDGAGGNTGIGFRRASTGTFSQSSGLLIGPAPAIRP